MKKLIVAGQLSAKNWQITINESTIKMSIIFIGIFQRNKCIL